LMVKHMENHHRTVHWSVLSTYQLTLIKHNRQVCHI